MYAFRVTNPVLHMDPYLHGVLHFIVWDEPLTFRGFVRGWRLWESHGRYLRCTEDNLVYPIEMFYQIKRLRRHLLLSVVLSNTITSGCFLVRMFSTACLMFLECSSSSQKNRITAQCTDLEEYIHLAVDRAR